MKKILLFTMLSIALLFTTSCSGEKNLGSAPSASDSRTPLMEILDNPSKFHNKTVVMQGVLTGQCASLCDFTFTERNQPVNIFMGEVKAPRIQTGTPVRVKVHVHAGEKQVIFTTLGMTINPREV